LRGPPDPQGRRATKVILAWQVQQVLRGQQVPQGLKDQLVQQVLRGQQVPQGLKDQLVLQALQALLGRPDPRVLKATQEIRDNAFRPLV
jgi:hypothetical protein